jgi:hypothetical protein
MLEDIKNLVKEQLDLDKLEECSERWVFEIHSETFETNKKRIIKKHKISAEELDLEMNLALGIYH